ncbi:MAG: hypothetical protein JWL77_4633 [Chthonomonadaceae bacterium]|jgi:hypothetical protein|nr:hypothetical protein [Chthonomonadaceae bacterium]
MRAAGLEEYVSGGDRERLGPFPRCDAQYLFSLQVFPRPVPPPVSNGLFYAPSALLSAPVLTVNRNEFTISSRQAGVDASHQHLKGIGLYAHH